jgi:predicted GH43/DUF377 family glycosyl hydrolase
MSEFPLPVRRLALALNPDPRRVLLRPFMPSLVVKPQANPTPNARVSAIFARVMVLDDAAAESKLDEVLAEFDERHQSIRAIFANRYADIRPLLPVDRELAEPRCLLLGSYFINEYSLESSALFNPSIVVAPDQGGLPAGSVRAIISLRATGEGHISSVTFRSVVISSDGEVQLDTVSRYVQQAQPHATALYDLKIFQRKLFETGIDHESLQTVTRDLPEQFPMTELVAGIRQQLNYPSGSAVRHACERALFLAQANYTVCFAEGLDISEKVLFPYAPTESNGMEDARFVRFTEPDGSVFYHATYTAYDGNSVLPQMATTCDFREFSFCTLNGPAVQNKGLALFPRRIGGRYAMLGRQDSENITLMFSEHLHFWHEARVIIRPSEPWEFVQMGNCGSPIETAQGWLVLTHGVGPMRKYCIGAVLLDLENPSIIRGRMRQPLLRPLPAERDGYVPNVVYTCGALVHGENLILPYAQSDTSTRFALVKMEEILAAMEPPTHF